MARATFWEQRHARFHPPAVEPLDSYDDVVVGAGAVGLAAAAELAARGRRVVVLEAHETLGDGNTARSTGKLSLLQGTRFSSIEKAGGPDAARAYLTTCREGVDWVEGVLDRWDVPVQRRPAATWAVEQSQIPSTRAEDEAARRAGLTTRWQREVPGGLPGHGAVVLEDQWQVDALQYTEGLCREAVSAGAHVLLGRRVRSVGKGSPVTVTCEDGLELVAAQVLLATGAPILDRSVAFATTKAQRSYILAFERASDFEPMTLSAGAPGLSLRGAPGDGTQSHVVLVGGHGHPVGREHPAGQHLESLRQWTHTYLDVGAELAAWSAQDYMSPDSQPLAGRVPGPAPVHAVTGFGKWGLLAGIGVARRLATAIADGADVPSVPSGRLLRPGSMLAVAGWNAEVGAHLTSGWAGAQTRAAAPPGEGQGVVSRGLRPDATSTVDGCRRTVSAVCPHLGGIVRWNDVEQSWDCPLHGSRFAADGRVLEGPATRGLTPDHPTPDDVAPTTEGESR
ncbi:FAD-dependent oxidoreductase [Aeromicrobium sp. CF4.19]|uniref:FAD-dependent oxidoreductase n=1 Tax=Aeromicrobium sp. CF4.19 TaxID=3373082 RepID=UPI003EE466D2